MGDWPAQRIQVPHDSLDSFGTRKHGAEHIPVAMMIWPSSPNVVKSSGSSDRGVMPLSTSCFLLASAAFLIWDGTRPASQPARIGPNRLFRSRSNSSSKVRDADCTFQDLCFGPPGSVALGEEQQMSSPSSVSDRRARPLGEPAEIKRSRPDRHADCHEPPARLLRPRNQEELRGDSTRLDSHAATWPWQGLLTLCSPSASASRPSSSP